MTTPKLLRPLWGLQRLPLLLWLAGQGPVTRADTAREFPAITNWLIGHALIEFHNAGWLIARGEDSFAFRRAALDELERCLDANLPGDWPAAERDEAALQGEINLWRSPNRLAVIRAVRDGMETRQHIQDATGLPSNSVSLAVLELLERGHITEREWVRWGEEPSNRKLAYQGRPSHIRRLIEELRGAAA